jgi:YVTN family beta-propeller protein
MFLGFTWSAAALDPPVSRELAPDQPEDEQTLNRELWEFAKKMPYSGALEHVAKAGRPETKPAAQIVLPNGWAIAPAGKQVEVGRFPNEMVLYAGRVVVLNTGYYMREPQEVSVVDPDSGQLVKVVRLDSIFPSACQGPGGDLYISGGDSRKIYRLNSKFDKVREYPVGGYTAGLTDLDANRIVIAYLVSAGSQKDFESGNYGKGKLAILNTDTGEIEAEATVGFFPHTVCTLNGKIYVSLLGEDKVQVYDTQLHFLRSIQVGRTPQGLCADAGRLYVVNTGSDSISVIDCEADSVVATIDIRIRGNRFGSAPVSCTVDGKRLYVAQSNVNAIAVLDKKSGKHLGSIPTGWYPTKVLFSNNRLLALSAKGIRPRRPNVDGPQPYPKKGGLQYVLTLLKGSVSIVPRAQIESRLPSWSRLVEKGAPVFSPSKGFRLPIRHVFFIVRENRSYDQVFGDLKNGDGDPYLTIFGQEITPNAHRLAEEFVVLDNYFANGEISALGHSFTTSGYAGPFLEWLANAVYAKRYNSYPFGTVPAATSPAYLWDALDEKGIDYRIYGENYFLYTRAYKIITNAYGEEGELSKKFYARSMTLASTVDRGAEFFELAKSSCGRTYSIEDAFRLLEDPVFASSLSRFLCGDESLSIAMADNQALRRQFAEYLYRYPFGYRSWDLHYSDIDRARVWKADFEKQLALGKVSQFHYIWLPNDHTAGVAKNHQTPDQLVAQNDAALGLIVETISRSAVWKESIIFVTEDDAQNGPDHVDATRTVALAIGPYVKRGALVHDRYDQLSMLRTIEVMLALPALNMNDALAVPMFGIFTAKPDYRTYTPTRVSDRLSDTDRMLYGEFPR